MDFYVTTSIPYVNGDPHLGHAMEFVMADVLARNARIQGKNTLFSTGSDEHGSKVAQKAEKQRITPKELADQMSARFKDLTKSLNISNDRFIRTTDPNHEATAQAIWTALKDDIYKKQYVGWYCTGDEAFFTEAVVKENNGICPNHNIPYEKVEEENYFFRLSKFNNDIKAAIESDRLRVMPESRKNEILQLIEGGLDDISISRPIETTSWGIAVPGDDTQVMYVWFEALLNYITVLSYPDGEDFTTFWPAHYQVIGKDILRFHAAIWPGILMSLKLPLPKTVYAHGFINVEGRKMSKSLGNFVNPEDIISKYGADSFRYFFLRHIPSYADGDFSWDKFHASYQNELGNELGNAVQRTVAMIVNYFDGAIKPSEIKISEVVSESIELCRFDRALDEIWAQIKTLNQYIDEKKPWMLHKNGEIDQLSEVLEAQVKQIRDIGAQLKPFLPETADKIESIFKGDKVVPLEGTLFPRIDLAETKA